MLRWSKPLRYPLKDSKINLVRRNHVLGAEQNENSDQKTKIISSKRGAPEPLCNCDNELILAKCTKSAKCQYRVEKIPVFIKTYGCQMNVNDSAIVGSILQEFGYQLVKDENLAEIYLLMTCAIRSSAEKKIWDRLNMLKRIKDDTSHPLRQIGLLGCMAERLKEKVLETDKVVDIVAGPDSYRDLPRLFGINRMTRDKAVNCLLSFDETYSDIRPITNRDNVTAFISITRGCDNLCSYCVVPFTRGRERTRTLPTILDEVNYLMKRGIREVTLLGQNVNSYRDVITSPESINREDLLESVKTRERTADGFKTVYKPRLKGLTFDVLLEEVAKLDPNLRIRFTSPHPKDFTDEVIDVIGKYPNISRCIHLPAQSGSNLVLERMRRGYTREAYLDLVRRMRNGIPGLALKSDFIVGFCGETEEDHQETLKLIEEVGYNYIYAYPYSERAKTHASYKFEDDVPNETKRRRHEEVAALFRSQATELNRQLIGSEQLVLVESKSRRSEQDWVGRIDSDIKTIIPCVSLKDIMSDEVRPVQPGDYVVCSIVEANSQTLKGKPQYISCPSLFQSSEKHYDRRKSNEPLASNDMADSVC